jgi:hypothetical protein
VNGDCFRGAIAPAFGANVRVNTCCANAPDGGANAPVGLGSLAVGLGALALGAVLAYFSGKENS